MMESVKKILTLFAATLLLLPIMEAQHYPPPRPLCASQFALASYACSAMPYTPMPTPQPPSPPAPSPPDDDDDDDDDDGGGDDGRDGDGDDGRDGDGDGDGGRDGGGDRPEHGSGHGHGRSHGHHHGHGRNRKQQRRHRHRHGHGHHHRSETPLSPQEDNCCKWLSQLDNQCVCELLLRLPTFLLKPAHTYSVIVGSSCNITYTCAHP